MLSVVIPTLNAAGELSATLRALAAAGNLIDEVIVSDGGSQDDTRDIAAAAGARVVLGLPGRGRQLGHGADHAQQPWLLFLHADTRLDRGWAAAAREFCAAPANAARAGYFRFALADSSAAARRLEAAVAWRCRWLALPYGDQGLLIARDFYRRLGGYPALPLMEDVEFVRRIGRPRLVALAADAVTSAARYRRDGYWARSVRNLTCLGLYFAGVSPQRIARLYG